MNIKQLPAMLLMILGCFAIYSALFMPSISLLMLGTLLLIGAVLQIINGYQKYPYNYYAALMATGFLALIPILFIFVYPSYQYFISLPKEHINALDVTFGLIIIAMLFIKAIIRVVAALTIKFRDWQSALILGIICAIISLDLFYFWVASSKIGLFIGIDLLLDAWMLGKLGQMSTKK